MTLTTADLLLLFKFLNKVKFYEEAFYYDEIWNILLKEQETLLKFSNEMFALFVLRSMINTIDVNKESVPLLFSSLVYMKDSEGLYSCLNKSNKEFSNSNYIIVKDLCFS